MSIVKTIGNRVFCEDPDCEEPEVPFHANEQRAVMVNGEKMFVCPGCWENWEDEARFQAENLEAMIESGHEPDLIEL